MKATGLNFMLLSNNIQIFPYLVLLRVEIAAFHPRLKQARLVSVALILNGRALPATPLSEARTFLIYNRRGCPTNALQSNTL